jgi:feruloyl esterase
VFEELSEVGANFMTQRLNRIFLAAMLAVGILLPCPGFAGQSCGSLASLELPHTTITKAQSVPAGPFDLPNPMGPQSRKINLPAFCRVAGEIKPASDSDIQFEVWMPTDGWNGKFDGTGNGGFAG